MIESSRPLETSRVASRGSRLLLAFGALGLSAIVGISCGGAAGSGSAGETNANWLKDCASEADCDRGSSCSCGRCTRECAGDADCAEFSAAAFCGAPASGCTAERLCMPLPAGRPVASTGESTTCQHAATDYIIEGDPRFCFGRELPECPPGSEAFVDSCGCGCGPAPDYPRECRDQCELAGDCTERRFEEFPNYDLTRESWANATEGLVSLVAGECGDGGRRFIYTANGFTAEARVFNAEGSFLGLSTSTDVIDLVCKGQGYWPEPVRCAPATVTEVLNVGLGLGEVGQVVRLPWGDGPPER